MRFMRTITPILALALLSPVATIADCPGDIDRDGVTDLNDLAILLEAHGASAGDPTYNPSADLDADGTVDLSDLAGLLDDRGCRAPDSIRPVFPTENLPFEEFVIGNQRVLFHQRMIGGATVEKDYIVYQLDQATGELLARKSHWREDLPAVLPAVRITQAQAEALVAGEILFSDLYIISPASDVFPLDPTPENPCWAVRSLSESGEYVVTIIDAVSGAILGNGVPPPYTAFSLSGPQMEDPCRHAWGSWFINAMEWFDAMGYSTEELEWPTKAQIQSHIQSDDTAMFYELAHSGGVSTQFASGCDDRTYEFTYASEIEAWMDGYQKMPFTFAGSCFSLCSTGPGTLAHAFSKGSNEDTTVIGYCGMSEPQCGECWSYSLLWQDALFYYLSIGYAVKDAFDQANADYPTCAGVNDCMRFAGDEDFAVVPVVSRAPARIRAEKQEAGPLPPAD
jgi:hypothetical protein